MHKSGNLKLFIILGLLFLETISVFLTFKSFSNRNVDEISVVNKVNKNVFAMYVENDEGKYDEYTASNYWPSGYKLNESMTMCIDNKGNNITVNSLIFNDNKMTVQSNKTIFCYLYFDKDKSVYAKVVSDYTNNNGVSKTSSTSAETGNAYDVYYYKGSITNNNILYGDYCWKMVRTTETNGVKLIYNGVPTTGTDVEGNITYNCDNTGSASQLSSTKAFNSNYNSPAYVGYMYNTVYKYNSKGYTSSTSVYTNTRMYSTTLYYYGDVAVWNEETQKYDLKISSDEGYIDVTETTAWSSSTYSSLVGKYTCRNTTATSCATVYYIAGASSSYMYNYGISNNTTKDDYKIKLATEITDNGDGTYTLVNPVEVKKSEWYSTSYKDYVSYYYCNDLISETCGTNNTIMYYSISTSATSLTGLNRANEYKYGNSFEPGETEGTYKLKDTDTSSIMQFWNWKENYNKINNNHYTCFNTTGECTEMKYIYYTNNSNAYYITLTDGDSIEDAINKMFDDNPEENYYVNKTDSTIKDYIDTWYEGAILDKIDANGVLYSNYLENAIFCNNRTITNLGGWNPNGGDTDSSYYMYFDYSKLECDDKEDRFTLKVESGGTEGYGNNALDYPIGLISYKEASLATGTGYLKSGNYYWLLSPRTFSNSDAYVRYVDSSGSLSNCVVYSTGGVRPSVSLITSVEIIGGDGSVSLPYQVEMRE